MTSALPTGATRYQPRPPSSGLLLRMILASSALTHLAYTTLSTRTAPLSVSIQSSLMPRICPWTRVPVESSKMAIRPTQRFGSTSVLTPWGLVEACCCPSSRGSSRISPCLDMKDEFSEHRNRGQPEPKGHCSNEHRLSPRGEGRRWRNEVSPGYGVSPVRLALHLFAAHPCG